MIASIVAWLIAKGVKDTVAPKVAKAGLIVGALLIAAAAFALWLALHDDKVIDRHEEKVAAEVEKSTNDAEDVADDKQEASAAEHAAEAEAERKEIRDAKAENRSPLDALFK